MEEIRELYRCLEKGYNSYPLHLPGTSYWKAMKVHYKSFIIIIIIIFSDNFFNYYYYYYFFLINLLLLLLLLLRIIVR